MNINKKLWWWVINSIGSESDWILETNFWDDSGTWIDNETWND